MTKPAPLSTSVTNIIDKAHHCLGLCLSWFGLLIAAIVCGIVVVRACCNIGSIFAQEIISYFHASLFMLGTAYAASIDGHVRVDIFYRKMSERRRAWVDAYGCILFLLPFSIFLTAITWENAVNSWAIREVSSSPGGVPAVFLLKSLMPVTGLLLILHSCSLLAKCWWVLVSSTKSNN